MLFNSTVLWWSENMQYHVQRNIVATTNHSVGFDCHLLLLL